mmetsp:Transcript_3887/g.5688  ORF Transcript_3887/g.5688 Transcript_3887/m.5688 type:complete len:101 (-) Transcript_3887:17-319(-)|eukprot:CAMPEP_0195508704 /NCGR_PEP_ID=MMETSP0794_2-20130614/1839_1 /TAXON_ID=515487 /ORGANISM="Stephanopyxis turris, Strain CCMP 815" /LENGTH=100 /DNA_ID=CAMNT_0040635727 /DNA_START=59 /DNA_END=361 /DNA_ORIENTATION=+
MSDQDRSNVNQSFSKNWEHLQVKNVGTGHPDISKYDWAVNHHRDSIASHIGHSDMLAFFSVAENESIGRMKFNLIERMVQPCGPPPQGPDDEDDDDDDEI